MSGAMNATVAKIKTAYGKLLKENDYNELYTKKKVTDAAEYLKQSTHFSKILSGVDTSSIHRGHLETLLNKAYYNEYERICNFQQLRKQPFFNFLLVRSEIRELLKAILYLNNERRDIYIQSMDTWLINKASFDLMELAKASNYYELLMVIRNTPYFMVLRSIRPDHNGNVPYTECEVLLRTYYMQWMLETVSINFDKKTADILCKQINVQIDIINIINGYRMKKYFDGSSTVMQMYSLPFHGRITKQRRNELFESENHEDFVNCLSKTVYGRLMENISEKMHSGEFETELTKVRCNIAKRALQSSDNAAVSLYSYMYLVEIEIQNITTIIESIRYGRNAAYMKKLIVQT